MGLRDIGARLPPGFRFYPSDEELVCHYLHNKVANEESLLATKTSLIEIDLHTCEPWQLPEVAKLNNSEWYFFSFRDRKYSTGSRTNRATTAGYWKATGKDRVVLDQRTRRTVGMRKTLVFYRNRAPNGIKTGWIMHEFRLENPNKTPQEDWVLCRVFHKSKEEGNAHNNSSQQVIIDHHDINTDNSANNTSSSSLTFKLATTCAPPLPPPPPPPPPLPSTTTTWGISASSSSSFQNQPPQNPTNSMAVSSEIIIPSSSPTSQKPYSSSQFLTLNTPATFISSSSSPNYYNSHGGEHLMKEDSSNVCPSSFSQLMNSDAINDEVYGFMWEMDLDQQETNNFCDYNYKLGDHNQGSGAVSGRVDHATLSTTPSSVAAPYHHYNDDFKDVGI